MNPKDDSPLGPTSPGDKANGPNKKFIPLLENESSFITIEFNQLNIDTPAGTLKMNKANIIWKLIPQKTRFQFIFFLFLEKSQAKAQITNTPKKLIKL